MFSIFICRTIPQSARWLFSKQKLEEGHEIIKVIAKVNGVSLNSEYIEVQTNDMKEKDTGFIDTMLQLFKHKGMTIRSCTVFLNW